MSTATHKLLKGATGDWEVVIGMEVHAQVTSESKLFSGASTAFGGSVTNNVPSTTIGEVSNVSVSLIWRIQAMWSLLILLVLI